MDNMSRSPLFSHISATISGLSSLRVYDVWDQYTRKNFEFIDNSSRTYFAFFQLNRWFGTRIDWLTATVSCVTAILCVCLRDTLPAGTAGLALIYALGAAGILQYSTRLLSETEAIFTSVERLNYLGKHTWCHHMRIFLDIFPLYSSVNVHLHYLLHHLLSQSTLYKIPTHPKNLHPIYQEMSS
jgi:hypothetical protein